MRISQLCLMTLALYTGTRGQDSNWKGCDRTAGLPAHSEIACNDDNGCIIRCTNSAATFDNGKPTLEVWCDNDQWKYLTSSDIPQCNGCDRTSGLPALTVATCDANDCNIHCTNGRKFTNGESSLQVSCDNGHWKYLTSTDIPQCSEGFDSIKECGQEGLPAHSEINCNEANDCIITCDNGYKFPNGKLSLAVSCDNGKWKYLSGTNNPQCRKGQFYSGAAGRSTGEMEVEELPLSAVESPEMRSMQHDGSCDITSVFDASYSCDYSFNQYTCDIRCSDEEEWVTHTCSQGWIWSPPINKCKPDYSKCVIEPEGFDWGYSCRYKAIGMSCNVWCTKEEDAVTHICDHSTGEWSPPLSKCIQDLTQCRNALDGYDGGLSCEYYSQVNQFICGSYCFKGEDPITHVCTPSTGIWSPPITKCKPENSKCDIKAVFNGGATCYYTNSGLKCDIYCTKKEDAVTHICSHSTGIWTPPITKCTRTYHKTSNGFNFNGCTSKGLPGGSSLRCRSSTGCEVRCISGYRLSNGEGHTKLECDGGHWTYFGQRYENMPGRPHCQPVCSPSCSNGGKCLRPGLCQCDEDFAGELCQYPRSNCDFKAMAKEHQGSANCQWDNNNVRCTLSCFGQKMTTHTCSYSIGRWSPPVGKCVWG